MTRRTSWTRSFETLLALGGLSLTTIASCPEPSSAFFEFEEEASGYTYEPSSSVTTPDVDRVSPSTPLLSSPSSGTNPTTGDSTVVPHTLDTVASRGIPTARGSAVTSTDDSPWIQGSSDDTLFDSERNHDHTSKFLARGDADSSPTWLNLHHFPYKDHEEPLERDHDDDVYF